MKSLQAPHLRRLVTERRALDGAYAARDAAIEARGHALQVSPQPGLSPLFLLHGAAGRVERRRIEWQGEHHFGLRGLDAPPRPIDELLTILEQNPSVVTPGVLARPAIQDAVLGTSLQVLGPGEVSYMAQAAPTYQVLGLDAPELTLRPQSLVLDRRAAGWLEELDLPLAELLDKSAEEIVAARLGSDPVTPVRQQIDALLAALGEQVLAIDAGLEAPIQKTRDHVGRGLDQLTAKVQTAVANRHQVWLRRIEKLRQTVLPGGSLQERKLATLFFFARYGEDGVRAVVDGLDLDPRRLSVIRLET